MQSKRPTAIVTGSSAGLGAAIARTLAQQGSHVLLCSRNEERLRQARDAIETDLQGRAEGRANPAEQPPIEPPFTAQSSNEPPPAAQSSPKVPPTAQASPEVPLTARSSNEQPSAPKSSTELPPSETPPQLRCLAGDVTDPATAPALVEEAKRVWGRLDVLVGNAGGPPPGTFEEHDDNAWRAAFDLILLSNIRLIRAALPLLRESPAGRIALIASISAFRPIPRLALSNTLRPALAGLVRDLAVELGESGILINAVSPGFFDTARSREVRASMAKMRGNSIQEVEAELTAKVPLGRQGRPPELGALVAFLCSAQNGFVTGQTIVADGGLLQRG